MFLRLRLLSQPVEFCLEQVGWWSYWRWLAHPTAAETDVLLRVQPLFALFFQYLMTHRLIICVRMDHIGSIKWQIIRQWLFCLCRDMVVSLYFSGLFGISVDTFRHSQFLPYVGHIAGYSMTFRLIICMKWPILVLSNGRFSDSDISVIPRSGRFFCILRACLTFS